MVGNLSMRVWSGGVGDDIDDEEVECGMGRISRHEMAAARDVDIVLIGGKTRMYKSR